MNNIKNFFYYFLKRIDQKLNKISKTFKFTIKNILKGILICFIALPIITSIIEYDRMPSESMLNAIDKGQSIFTFKLYYGITIKPFVSKITGKTIVFNTPKKGDIILMKHPHSNEISMLNNLFSYMLYFFSFGFIDTYKEDYFIKRVIALPTETIEIRDKIIYINGIPVEEEYNILHKDNRILDKIISNRDNFGPYVVPFNEYFVLSDNRDYSYDSRNFGFISFEDIKGKVLGNY